MDNIGILDPEGKNNNPLTDRPYSDEYKEIAKKWSNFPAYEKAKDIIEDIKNYQVILITASTGSGKTVLVPKYALHALNYKGKIAITLPKQIIAKSSAEFAAKTLDVQLGEHVGYQYKGSPKGAKSNDTQLLYATDGTIVARLLNDPKLEDFDAVIIDEAHERKVQIDFLLYLLKETIQLRPEFKVIIMSATINADIFTEYFAKFKFKQMNIAGRTNYPIESIFLKEPLKYNEAIDKGMEILVELLNKEEEVEGANDIMFFITSINETFEMCKRLDKLATEYNLVKKGNTFCIEVYAGMDAKNQTLAQDRTLYKEQGGYKRKVVVATNVAESSLTIDGIKYVIDAGHELFGSYDAVFRAKTLNRTIITQAQAKQRMGRSGRTGPGVCYHLYTKDTFENGMQKYPEPDIRTSDISNECIRLLNLEKIGDVNNLKKVLNEFIEPPNRDNVESAITDLIQLGIVENDKISKIGKMAAQIGGNDYKSALAIILGKIYNCSYEITKIISMMEACKLNLSAIFRSPKSITKDKKRLKVLKEKYKKGKSKFKHKYGDHISLLRVFQKYEELIKKHNNNYDTINKWAHTHFIKIKTLVKARKYYRKYMNQIRRVISREFKAEDVGIKQREDILRSNVDDRIIVCLLAAHRINTAVKRSFGDVYRTQHSQELNVKIGEDSFLTLSKKLPKNVFYNELFIFGSRASLNVVSKITDEIYNLLK